MAGMEVAEKKFPNDFFEFIIKKCWATLYRLVHFSRSEAFTGVTV